VTARVACPKTAAVDSAIQVKWQGPGHKGDYICISRPDQKPGRYVNYQYTGKGNPLTVKAPKAPGAYEIRYILGRGKKCWPPSPLPSNDAMVGFVYYIGWFGNLPWMDL
jgi:Ca-activated chloride channel family protein